MHQDMGVSVEVSQSTHQARRRGGKKRPQIRQSDPEQPPERNDGVEIAVGQNAFSQIAVIDQRSPNRNVRCSLHSCNLRGNLVNDGLFNTRPPLDFHYAL